MIVIDVWAWASLGLLMVSGFLVPVSLLAVMIERYDGKWSMRLLSAMVGAAALSVPGLMVKTMLVATGG
jgi:hypothetical protein